MSEDTDRKFFNSTNTFTQTHNTSTMVEIPLETLKSYYQHFQGLSVELFDTLDDALASLASRDFSKNFDNSSLNVNGMIVKLTGKAQPLNERQAEMLLTKYGQDRSIVLAFESVADGVCYINWKAAGRNEFLFVAVAKQQDGHEGEFYEFVLNFVLNAIKNQHPGCKEKILDELEGKAVGLATKYLCDHRGNNLLMSAVESNNTTVINSLIELNFNINDEIKGRTAADIAWNCGNLDVLHQLLKNNSVFPKDFDVGSLPDGELKAFVSVTEEFHQYLHARNKSSIKRIIHENPNLRSFLNFSNKSAIRVAIEMKDLELYKLLISNNVRIGSNEDFEEIMKNLSEDELYRVRKIHDELAIPIPEKQVMTLLQNSKFSLDDKNVEGRTNFILQALLYLNKIPQITLILVTVAAVKDFCITYDFNNYSVHYIDPTSNKSIFGIFYRSRMIYIGAKQFLNSIYQVSAYATLGHELCHLAMDLVYDNLCKPYHKDDKVNRDKFEKICKECEELKGHEKIIEDVYVYPLEEQHAELIVRIPHMIAEYQNDPARLKHLLGVFKSLNDYYNEKVLKDMETALPDIENKAKVKFEKAQRKAEMRKRIIIILGVGLVFVLVVAVCSVFLVTSYYKEHYMLPERAYSWHNLTDKERASVENANIIFQGYNITFKELLANNSKALTLLSSDQIKNIIKNNYLNIGDKFKSNANFYVERSFIRSDFKKWEEEYFNFENLTQVLEEEKVIILSVKAGSGKTTTYKKLVEKLKQKYRVKWISYVDLKKHFDAYEAKVTVKDWDKEKLVEFIGKDLLCLNESLEFSIFEERFNSDNIILLWDGVDEVSPHYEDFIANLFSNIKEFSDNSQWISTRPQYKDILKKKLNQKFSYSLKPYSKADRVDFLRKFFNFHNLTIDLIEQKIQLFNEKVKGFDKTNDELDNPLIIRMFGELLLDSNNSPLKLDNKYLLYKEFVNKSFHIAPEKGDIVTKDLQKIAQNERANMCKIYEHFALKTLIGKFNLQIEDMTIDLSFEEISRYGIMLITSNDNYEFIHRTFAEFFVAQYIINNVIQPDYTPRDEEIKPRMELLFYIANSNEEFKVVIDFVNAFLSLNSTQKRDKKFAEIATKELISLADKHLKLSCFKNNNNLESKLLKVFDFIAQLMRSNEQFLRNLWRLNEDENLFIFLTKPNPNFKFDGIILSLAGKHLPCEFTSEKIKNMSIDHTGNILFNHWYYYDKIKHKAPFYPEIIKLFPENLKNSKNFTIFFNEMKEILTENQLKLMIQSNMYQMLGRMEAQDLLQFIQTVNETLSREETRQSFVPRCRQYFYFDQKFEFADENYVENLVNTFDQYFDKTIIETFLKEVNVFKYSVANGNPSVFKKFSKFALKYMKHEDIDNILKTNKKLISDAIFWSSIATCESLANFTKTFYASNKSDLMKLLYEKDKRGKTIFARYSYGVEKLRLEPFRILAREFPFPIPTEILNFDRNLTFNSNLYSVLERFVEKKLNNSSELMRAHVFYALKSDKKFNVTVSLPDNLTLSELNEPGLLNLTSLEEPNFSQDLYRDLFLAKILIDKLYNARNNSSEVEKTFHFFKDIVKFEKRYSNVTALTLNYLDFDATQVKVFPPWIREKVKKNTYDLVKQSSCVHFLLKFFSKDEELLYFLLAESLTSREYFDDLECIKPVYDTVNIEKLLQNAEFRGKIVGRIEEIKDESLKLLFPELIEAFRYELE